MASIIREILIDTEPTDAWDASRDFSVVQERLVPGFVVESVMDGPDSRVPHLLQRGRGARGPRRCR